MQLQLHNNEEGKPQVRQNTLNRHYKNALKRISQSQFPKTLKNKHKNDTRYISALTGLSQNFIK